MMTVAHSEQFTDKGKLITYIKAFIELYKWKNRGQVYEIFGIVEFEKMCASIAKHARNLGAHHIVKISLILRSTHAAPRDQERIMFYINNYID